MKRVVHIACAFLWLAVVAVAGCDRNEPQVVLELGQGGPRYLPGEQITMYYGTALYVRFQRIYKNREETVGYDRMGHPPVEVIEGQSTAAVIPDAEEPNWFLLAIGPGSAKVRVQDKGTFLVKVIEQPTDIPERPEVETADAGTD